jgi:hypothetical protein
MLEVNEAGGLPCWRPRLRCGRVTILADDESGAAREESTRHVMTTQTKPETANATPASPLDRKPTGELGFEETLWQAASVAYSISKRVATVAVRCRAECAIEPRAVRCKRPLEETAPPALSERRIQHTASQLAA